VGAYEENMDVRKGSRRRSIWVALLVGLVAVVMPANLVFAGAVTLHPAGFGEKSYAAWKAHEGQDDPGNNGLPQQALYFQKLTATETNAAGVAVFKGFEGIAVADIQGLSWTHRDDGWCGAGAPRWNIVSQDPVTHTKYIIFLGCAAAAHEPDSTSENKSGHHEWTKDTQPSLAGMSCRELGSPYTTEPSGFCDDFPLTQLAIVFDEGTTSAGAPLGPGFVHLDKITVRAGPIVKTWNNASDNSNQTAVRPVVGPAVAYALGGDLVPGTSILDDLQALFPGVPVTEFVLYPDVLP
jgi:hypothetical protein